MNTITVDAPARPDLAMSGRAARIWPGLAGLLSIGALVALFVSPAGEDTGETPAEVVAFAADKDAWVVAGTLSAVALVALLASFVAGLHGALRHAAGTTQSTAIALGGGAFTILFPLAFVVWFAPLLDLPDDRARGIAHAEAYLAMDDIGWVVFGAAGVAAAVMATTASWVALRGRLVPAWLGWLGLLLGVASLATLAFFGMFAWMAWIAGASVLLLVSRR